MSPIKVEVGQYREVNKGALKAFFTLIIHDTGQKISECSYFISGVKRWFNFPQKEMKYTDGRKTTYYSYITFLNRDYSDALQNAVLEELKKQTGSTNGQATNKANPRQENPLPSDASADWGEVPF